MCLAGGLVAHRSGLAETFPRVGTHYLRVQVKVEELAELAGTSEELSGMLSRAADWSARANRPSDANQQHHPSSRVMARLADRLDDLRRAVGQDSYEAHLAELEAALPAVWRAAQESVDPVLIR